MTAFVTNLLPCDFKRGNRFKGPRYESVRRYRAQSLVPLVRGGKLRDALSTASTYPKCHRRRKVASNLRVPFSYGISNSWLREYRTQLSSAKLLSHYSKKMLEGQ